MNLLNFFKSLERVTSACWFSSVFQNSMQVSEFSPLECLCSAVSHRILHSDVLQPDLAKFGMTKLDAAFAAVLVRLVADLGGKAF